MLNSVGFLVCVHSMIRHEGTRINIASGRGLTNLELTEDARKLGIQYFRGVFMRDELPKEPRHQECGIVNFNTSKEHGSHWLCYNKNGSDRLYFDSFGQVAPLEIQKYLKKKEFESSKAVTQRNTDIVQHVNTHVCGHLCLFVLTSLTREHLSYQDVLKQLNDGYTQGVW